MSQHPGGNRRRYIDPLDRDERGSSRKDLPNKHKARRGNISKHPIEHGQQRQGSAVSVVGHIRSGHPQQPMTDEERLRQQQLWHQRQQEQLLWQQEQQLMQQQIQQQYLQQLQQPQQMHQQILHPQQQAWPYVQPTKPDQHQTPQGTTSVGQQCLGQQCLGQHGEQCTQFRPMLDSNATSTQAQPVDGTKSLTEPSRHEPAQSQMVATVDAGSSHDETADDIASEPAEPNAKRQRFATTSIAGIAVCVVAVIMALAIMLVVTIGVDGSAGIEGSIAAQSSAASSASGSGDGSADADGGSNPTEGERTFENLALGETADLEDGLAITLNSVEEGLVNYEGESIACINVTYANHSASIAAYSSFGWKAEDASGTLKAPTYYASGDDALTSGTLAEGEEVSGNIYFEGSLAKVIYTGSLISDSPIASWVAN